MAVPDFVQPCISRNPSAGGRVKARLPAGVSSENMGGVAEMWMISGHMDELDTRMAWMVFLLSESITSSMLG